MTRYSVEHRPLTNKSFPWAVVDNDDAAQLARFATRDDAELFAKLKEPKLAEPIDYTDEEKADMAHFSKTFGG